MPYCTNCGEEVTDEQRYCSYCGEALGDVPQNNRGNSGQARATRHDPAPEQTNESDGFEGDPPPEGYEDPPGVGTGSRPDSGLPDTISLYGASLREIVGYPAMLVGLFVAWLAFFLIDFLSPAVQFPGVVLSGLFGLFVAGVIHVAVEHAREERPSTVGDQASQVTGRFLPLVGIWILFVPAFLFGTLFLLLPGLYIAARLFLAFPACVLDDESSLESLSTSWELTSGISLKPFGLLLLAFISALILSVLFSLLSTGVLLAGGADLPAEPGESPEAVANDLAEQPAFLVATALSQSIALAIVVGAVQVAAARLYLTLRYGESEPQAR